MLAKKGSVYAGRFKACSIAKVVGCWWLLDFVFSWQTTD